MKDRQQSSKTIVWLLYDCRTSIQDLWRLSYDFCWFLPIIVRLSYDSRTTVVRLWKNCVGLSTSTATTRTTIARPSHANAMSIQALQILTSYQDCVWCSYNCRTTIADRHMISADWCTISTTLFWSALDFEHAQKPENRPTSVADPLQTPADSCRLPKTGDSLVNDCRTTIRDWPWFVRSQVVVGGRKLVGSAVWLGL
jgi:hypothetical protein